MGSHKVDVLIVFCTNHCVCVAAAAVVVVGRVVVWWWWWWLGGGRGQWPPPRKPLLAPSLNCGLHFDYMYEKKLKINRFFFYFGS